jgi:hypothetical protein
MIKSNFYTTLDLPSLDKKIKIKEINNCYYIDILKFIQNSNLEELINFFDLIISENTDADINALTNLDKFCILIEMRSVSIGNIIEFSIDNKNIKYNLSDICTKIQNLKNINKTIKIDNLNFELGIPKKLIIPNYNDIIQSCIKKINDIDLDTFTNIEKESLYKMIPAHIYNDIKNFIIENTEYIESQNIFNLSIVESFKDFKINPFNNSLIELLKNIYSDNLMNFYDLQFNLITKLHISYDHFMSMTYNEARMYVAMQNKEIKKQEEAEKKSQGKLSL